MPLDLPSFPSIAVAKLNFLKCPFKMSFSLMKRSRWSSKTPAQPHGAAEGLAPVTGSPWQEVASHRVVPMGWQKIPKAHPDQCIREPAAKSCTTCISSC